MCRRAGHDQDFDVFLIAVRFVQLPVDLIGQPCDFDIAGAELYGRDFDDRGVLYGEVQQVGGLSDQQGVGNLRTEITAITLAIPFFFDYFFRVAF